MNFVTKRSFLMKLIISVFLIVFLFNSIGANYSYGVWGVDIVELVVGSIYKPFIQLIATILCGINGALSLFLGGTDTFQEIMNQVKAKEQAQFR